MKIQLEKYDPDKDTNGKMFFQIKKWGIGRKKSWGYQMQLGGLVRPNWARHKEIFTAGIYGWGSAFATIKFATDAANEFGVNAFFDLSASAKKELSCMDQIVFFCGEGPAKS